MTELPTGWATATVGDIAELTDGPFGSNLKTAHYTEDGPRVVRLQNIGEGSFRDERAHITQEHYEQLAKHAVRRGDILAASLGQEAPRACLVPAWLGPAIVKADCIRVRTYEGIAPGFLMWMLNSPPVRKQASSSIKGIGRPRLGLGGIRQLDIPLPPLNEQRRIAAAIEEEFSRLDAADRMIRAALRRISILRRAILVSVIPRPLPSHWKMLTVDDVGSVQLGRQRSPKYHRGPNMKPYLRVANVFEDRLDLSDVMHMDFSPEQLERYSLHPGDILLNEGQSPHLVGRPAMFRGELPEVCFTNSLIRFQPGPNVDGEFALLVFRSHLHSGRFQREARITTNIAHMAAGRFKTIEFPVPPEEEQLVLVTETQRQLSLVDALERDVGRAVQRGQALRRSILELAFRGKLVPQDPGDEPASELLMRNAASRPASMRKRRVIA